MVSYLFLLDCNEYIFCRSIVKLFGESIYTLTICTSLIALTEYSRFIRVALHDLPVLS